MYVIDRIEATVAICEYIETGNKIEIEISQLPSNIKEGDILEFLDGNYFINHKLTEERRKKIREKAMRLWK